MDVECKNCGAENCVRNSRARIFLNEIRNLQRKFKSGVSISIRCKDCGADIRITEKMLVKQGVSEHDYRKEE